MAKLNKKILVTWVARSNDPYESGSKKVDDAVNKDGNKIDGPTLALLFHPDSFLCGQVTDLITFCRKSTKSLKLGDRTDAVVSRELKQAIDGRSKQRITHTLIPWENDDPTDHEALFSFLKKQLPEIRIKNPLAEIYLHLSPGTPQMHAIMLLMATSGFVTPALKMVKSYRSTDGKKGCERFKELRLDISPFYQSYRNSRPHIVSTIEPGTNLMPDDFEPKGLMRECYKNASKIALTDLPVLITGEIGTGKHAVASWIRLKSNYCIEVNNSSWPAVSCGAHSSIDSFSQVLFGDRGKGYHGVLASAEGETLLLDEIDRLSPEAQRVLVQLLDRAKFRLIATSNLPLIDAYENLIEPLKKRFMLPALELPPLRKVQNDIVVFWKSIFREAVLKYIDEHQQQKVMAWGSTYCANIVALLKSRTLPGNLYDLKKIAATIVTSVSLNPHHKDAKEIYLQAISEHDATKSEAAPHDITKVIALAFATGKQLDDELPIGELKAKGKLKIKGFEKELKKFIADEINRLATEMKCGKESLCDLDRKTILEWSNQNREQNGKKCS